MSELINISLADKPDITHVQENFNTLNNDKLEVSNIVQGENISINVVDKIITISSTGGGCTGVDGVSLQYNWDGTSLGIKREDEINYTYVNLKGQDGIIGSDGADGRNIEMRYDSTYLQYRLVGDMDWINLVQIETTGDLTALTGRVSTLETNQGDLTQVPIELQNKTIAEMITENFTSGSNWKSTVANAITAKGVDTLATDSLTTFENNIGLINGGTIIDGIDEYTYLMLHGEDFTDSSPTPKTITNSGGTLVSGKFGNAIQTTGINSVAIGAIGDYNFIHNGLEDFTISFQFKPITGYDWYINSNDSNSANVGFVIDYTSSTKAIRLVISKGVAGTYPIIMASDQLLQGVFNHIIIQKKGTVYSIYRDGILRVAQRATTSHSTANHSVIPRIGLARSGFDSRGIVDELKIDRGIARHNGDFEPPTAPYTNSGEPVVPVSTPPIPRRHHSSVQIADKEYIYGGYNGTNMFNDLYEYDRSINLWTKKSDSPLLGRQGHIATAYNGEMYIFGGVTPSVNGTNEFMKYNPTTNLWTILPTPIQIAGRSHGSGVIDVDKWYVFAGHAIGSVIANDLNDLWVYDFTNQTWTQKASNTYRRSAQTASIYNGKMYSFGGDSNQPSNAPISVYDITFDTWEEKTAPWGYIHKATSVTYGGFIYVYAGNTLSANTSTLRKYNPIDNSFTTKLNGLEAVNSHSTVLDVNNMVVFGGNTFIGNGTSNKHYQYNFTTEVWTNK